MTSPRFLAGLLLLTASLSAVAAPRIRITDAYSHPTAAPGVPGVGYLTLTNTAKKADRLLAVTSPVAGSVEIHRSEMQGGVMRMRALTDGVPLPSGKPVQFGPGSLHLMLFDLQQPLQSGATVPLTLRFARAGTVEAKLQVQPREDAAEAAAEDHSHHAH